MILTPEKRFLAHEIAEIRVKRAENGSKTLVGYAAKFDKLSQDLGGFVEKIDPRAFDRCVKRCDVRGLKNHDMNMLLGRTKSGTMQLTIDDEGLRYDIALPETQVARDLVTEIERGDIDGSSFSFMLEPDGGDSWDDSTSPPTRTLLSVRDLFDVGPVASPAYLDTTTGVRAFGECRSFEQFKESRALERKREEGLRAAANLQRVRILKLRLGQPIF